MRIAIVDDTQMDAEILKRYISEYITDDVTRDLSIFLNGKTFVETFQAYSYDLVFLDIFMPEMTGIEIAEFIRRTDKEVKIVFCTTSNEFASESYSVKASYYLCKPFTKEHFQRMLSIVMPKEDEAVMMVLPDAQRIVPRNIMYTVYFNHKITIYMENGEVVETWLRQSQIEDIFAEYTYLKTCNRGNIVNFHYVVSYDKTNLEMSNGESIAVSRRMEKDVTKAYEEFQFRQSKKKV